ncbi:MAG: PEP-CTERM sorting domain-containing protein [Acidobacteria bacterium]|nr:PEP-CTERM sorting domain-containing protein [Acidobacteriota bacterium]
MRYLILVLACHTAANATVLYDNMGVANLYLNNAGRVTYTPFDLAERATRFTITTTATLTGFEAILSLPCCGVPAQSSNLTITVYNDSSGVGSALDSTSVTAFLPSPASVGLPVFSVGFSGGAVLTPGSYFVGIQNSDENMAWYLNQAVALTTPWASRSMSTGLWTYAGTDRNFTTRILGDPVPEPATGGLMLMAACFGAFACTRRKIGSKATSKFTT